MRSLLGPGVGEQLLEVTITLGIVDTAVESWNNWRHVRILYTHVGPQPNVLIVH